MGGRGPAYGNLQLGPSTCNPCVHAMENTRNTRRDHEKHTPHTRKKHTKHAAKSRKHTKTHSFFFMPPAFASLLLFGIWHLVSGHSRRLPATSLCRHSR